MTLLPCNAQTDARTEVIESKHSTRDWSIIKLLPGITHNGARTRVVGSSSVEDLFSITAMPGQPPAASAASLKVCGIPPRAPNAILPISYWPSADPPSAAARGAHSRGKSYGVKAEAWCLLIQNDACLSGNECQSGNKGMIGTSGSGAC